MKLMKTIDILREFLLFIVFMTVIYYLTSTRNITDIAIHGHKYLQEIGFNSIKYKEKRNDIVHGGSIIYRVNYKNIGKFEVTLIKKDTTLKIDDIEYY